MADGKIKQVEWTIQQAVEEFGKATKGYPGDAQAHFNLASAYYAAGQFDEALAELQDALALNLKRC
jgi:Flp pilus assembly protein TadD